MEITGSILGDRLVHGVEVITGPERRRRWSAEQKRAIVAASLRLAGHTLDRCAAAFENTPGAPSSSCFFQ